MGIVNFMDYDPFMEFNPFHRIYFIFADHSRIGQPYLEEVQMGGFRSYSRAESVRNIFLLKWKIFEALPIKEFYNHPQHFDHLLTKEIRRLVPLTIATDKVYGQLVDVTDFESPNQNSENGEFYRIFQNHQLWEKRYIKSNVSKKS